MGKDTVLYLGLQRYAKIGTVTSPMQNHQQKPSAEHYAPCLSALVPYCLPSGRVTFAFFPAQHSRTRHATVPGVGKGDASVATETSLFLSTLYA